jgi:hypothetical protein
MILPEFLFFVGILVKILKFQPKISIFSGYSGVKRRKKIVILSMRIGLIAAVEFEPTTKQIIMEQVFPSKPVSSIPYRRDRKQLAYWMQWGELDSPPLAPPGTVLLLWTGSSA